MSERPTPEVDAEASPHIGFYSCATVPADFARRLERERDEARERNLQLIIERERWKVKAEEKISLRKEIEEILGVQSNQASDEQLMAGVDALRKLKQELDEAREELSRLSKTLAANQSK